MALKTVDIEASAIYTFSYDPDSAAFKEALAGYREVINKNGNEESMLQDVVHHIRRRGNASSMVDGVGYVQKEGETPKELFSGISVADEDPDFNYEFL